MKKIDNFKKTRPWIKGKALTFTQAYIKMMQGEYVTSEHWKNKSIIDYIEIEKTEKHKNYGGIVKDEGGNVHAFWSEKEIKGKWYVIDQRLFTVNSPYKTEED